MRGAGAGDGHGAMTRSESTRARRLRRDPDGCRARAYGFGCATDDSMAGNSSGRCRSIAMSSTSAVRMLADHRGARRRPALDEQRSRGRSADDSARSVRLPRACASGTTTCRSNTDGVLETILSTLTQLDRQPLTPDPLPCGEREREKETECAAPSFRGRAAVPNAARSLSPAGPPQRGEGWGEGLRAAELAITCNGSLIHD